MDRQNGNEQIQYQYDMQNSYGAMPQNPNMQSPYGAMPQNPNMQSPYGVMPQNPNMQSPYGAMPQNPNMQSPYGAMPQNPNVQQRPKRKFITASMCLGILSAVLLVVGVFAPAMDFSAFHSSVHIQYNLMKICENVGLISDMWRGIPIGILIAAVLMAGLSFVRIPPLKVVPCVIVVIMIVLMIVDSGNVVSFIKDLINHFSDSVSTGGTSGSFIAPVETAFRSFRAGVYLLFVGLVCGLVSCFVSNKQ